MVNASPSYKHKILLEYRRGDSKNSFSKIAHRHGIRGGKRTVQRWFQRWDGTLGSLTRKKGSGGKVKLTRKQQALYITKPIRKANRNHAAIHYTDIMETIEEKTHQSISLRTIQRRGKEDEGIRYSTTHSMMDIERTVI